ncbi:titin-like [Diachasmimorpha longicaudata]|uniref:titin-like n=1 Tax=Diachasmimorpha longicaudata TaxID=58733 RepID=UPI0030B89CC4
MSLINLKFSKFDNTPWGFRLVGGSDFPQPLTVIRVAEGSLAECMGLNVGDVVVRLNDDPVSKLTHGEAHESLVQAGNNFTLVVHRGEEARQVAEAIQEENIVPYKPIDEVKALKALVEDLRDPEELPPLDGPSLDLNSDDEGERKRQSPELQEPAKIEVIEDRSPQPAIRDPNVEPLPRKDLTEEEIADLIVEEEELLEVEDKSVLGVNFNKIRPRAPLLRESKVLEELQKIAVEEPPRVQELKHQTTFLQKPERPIPKKKDDNNENQSEGYKVVIKKQPKKSVTEKLAQRGLLKTPEPCNKNQSSEPAITPEPLEMSRPESSASGPRIVEIPIEVEGRPSSKASSHPRSDGPSGDEKCSSRCESYREQTPEPEPEPESKPEPQAPIFDKEKVKALVSTEINLEKQLESVQNQLLALKQLPSEIENHLRIVSEQLHKIMELSGVQNSESSSRRGSSDVASQAGPREEDTATREECKNEDEDHLHVSESEFSRSSPATVISETPSIIEPESEMEQVGESETSEMEVTLKDDEHRVKKYIASYETKVFRSRDPSPAPSHGSYEPDPNMSPKDQVIQELKHRGGRKRSHDLWPQAKQLELTYGRRWRCPNDFFNDEMIAEVLSGQAEVIRGKALGVNFKKYEKAWLPNYDHLMNSSVYKMLHKMEREPKTGIPARPPKVVAAEDILERVKTPA